jgi:hypothetical protein
MSGPLEDQILKQTGIDVNWGRGGGFYWLVLAPFQSSPQENLSQKNNAKCSSFCGLRQRCVDFDLSLQFEPSQKPLRASPQIGMLLTLTTKDQFPSRYSR